LISLFQLRVGGMLAQTRPYWQGKGPVVVTELEFRNVQRQILGADLVERTLPHLRCTGTDIILLMQRAFALERY
jgi:hypothetical protein